MLSTHQVFAKSDDKIIFSKKERYLTLVNIFIYDKMDYDKLETSNICFFEYSFLRSLEKNLDKVSLNKVLELFRRVLDYHRQVEYKPDTYHWYWCISNNKVVNIDGSDYLFGILNKIRPTEIEKIFSKHCKG